MNLWRLSRLAPGNVSASHGATRSLPSALTASSAIITQHAGRGSNSQPSGERDGLYLERGNAPAVSVASFAGMRKAAHAKNQSCPGDVPMDCKTGYGLLTGSCRVPRPFLLALK